MFFFCLAHEIGDGKVNLKLCVHSGCHKSLQLVKGRGLALVLPWSWLHGPVPYSVVPWLPDVFLLRWCGFLSLEWLFAGAFLSCCSELKSALRCIPGDTQWAGGWGLAILAPLGSGAHTLVSPGTVPSPSDFLYYFSFVLLFYFGCREGDNLYFSLLTGRGWLEGVWAKGRNWL